jgi:hypothetical protein
MFRRNIPWVEKDPSQIRRSVGTVGALNYKTQRLNK